MEALGGGEARRDTFNVYKGLKDRDTHQRGVEACEQVWNKESTVGSLDDLLFSQVECAIQNGRTSLMVCDIGSGDGYLFEDFLNNGELGTKTRELLTKHTNFKIDFIGLTDAESSEDIFQEKLIECKNEDIDNSQITARNVFYSLTATQTLDNFLKNLNVQNVDLFLSTWCLTYVGPKVFKQTLDAVDNYLRDRTGVAILAAYAEKEAPGFHKSANAMPHVVSIPDKIKQESPRARSLGGDSLRFFKRDADIEEEIRGLNEAEQLMLQLGVLSQEELRQNRNYYKRAIESGQSRSAALVVRENSTVGIGVKRLAKKQYEKMAQIKRDILSRMKDGSTSIKFQSHTIVIDKK